MAIGKRKTVVIYTALAVVIGTATIVGVLAFTGRINLRIRADDSRPPSDAFDVPHRRWTLLANPCALRDIRDNEQVQSIGSILGDNRYYKAWMDNSGSWTDDITKKTGRDMLKRGFAYWVYNHRQSDTKMWWRPSATTSTASCVLDTGTDGDNPAAPYTLQLGPMAGKFIAVGNPYYKASTSLADIRVSFGAEDQGSLKDLLESQAEGGANAASKKVKLIFYDKDTGYSGYETWTGTGVNDCAYTGGIVIPPGKAFYIAFAPSIGPTDISLKFTPVNVADIPGCETLF